jgi:hypothetical protein
MAPWPRQGFLVLGQVRLQPLNGGAQLFSVAAEALDVGVQALTVAGQALVTSQEIPILQLETGGLLIAGDAGKKRDDLILRVHLAGGGGQVQLCIERPRRRSRTPCPSAEVLSRPHAPRAGPNRRPAERTRGARRREARVWGRGQRRLPRGSQAPDDQQCACGALLRLAIPSPTVDPVASQRRRIRARRSGLGRPVTSYHDGRPPDQMSRRSRPVGPNRADRRFASAHKH